MKKMFAALMVVIDLIACNRTTQNAVKYSETAVLVPTVFAEGVISTPTASEFEISFSLDGRTAYFTRRKPDEKQKIYETTFQNGVWLTPKIVDFSTDRDEAVFVSPDGKTLFFGSERPIPNKPNEGNFDMNIWKLDKTDKGWVNPVPLSEPINQVQVSGEEWPSSNANFIFSLDGRKYFYSTMARGEKAIDIYQTDRINDTLFSKPSKIKGLFEDEKFSKYMPVISPDGKYMVFNSFEAPGGVGGEDIYVSKKTLAGWSRAVSIGKLVNTKAEEGSPRFSRDGEYFFFGREFRADPAKDGDYNIYYIETNALKLGNLFPNE